jgi:hypothetical protein
MGSCHISSDKRQVCGQLERFGGKLAGFRMKIYLGIHMAKGTFDYCAMDKNLNILRRGSNVEIRSKDSESCQI